MQWTSEIMSDPMREHKLHVELQEDGHFRGRLYQDESGKLQLQIYAGSESTMPVDWLLGIIQRFSEDAKIAEGAAKAQTQLESALTGR